MLIQLLSLLIMVILGVAARRLYAIDPKKLSEVTMDLFLPPFIFFSILDADLRPDDLIHPALSCAVVILGTIAVVALAGRRFIPFALPIAFMNSGYLAIPVARTLGGETWVYRALIYDQMMNILIFTAGMAILGASQGLKRFFLNPALLSIFLAAAWRAAELGFPEWLRLLLRFPAEAAIPLALFSLGVALHDLKIKAFRPVLAATAARYLLGGIFAFLYVKIASVDHATAQVIFLSSTMPAAVFSFLLAERYGGEADYAAGVVFFSTVLYPIIFPIVFMVMKTL